MNQNELKAEMLNKLQALRTIVEHLEKGEPIPASMIRVSIDDLKRLEELADSIEEE